MARHALIQEGKRLGRDPVREPLAHARRARQPVGTHDEINQIERRQRACVGRVPVDHAGQLVRRVEQRIPQPEIAVRVHRSRRTCGEARAQIGNQRGVGAFDPGARGQAGYACHRATEVFLPSVRLPIRRGLLQLRKKSFRRQDHLVRGTTGFQNRRAILPGHGRLDRVKEPRGFPGQHDGRASAGEKRRHPLRSVRAFSTRSRSGAAAARWWRTTEAWPRTIDRRVCARSGCLYASGECRRDGSPAGDVATGPRRRARPTSCEARRSRSVRGTGCVRQSARGRS